MEKINWLQNSSTEIIAEKDKKFWDSLVQNAYLSTNGRFRIPISLEPFVVEKREFENARNNLVLLISAAKKIAEKYFEDERIREIVVINELENDLIEKSKNEKFIGVVRADLFFADVPKLVEINADFPDGFFLHDVTLKNIAENLENENLEFQNHAELFHKLLLSEGINLEARVFIGFDKERVFTDEFYLTKSQLEKFGWKNVSVGAFDDLEFRENNLYFKNLKIDVIRRGAELFKLRKIPGLIENIVQTEKNGLKVINNFKMRLLGHKALMAALCDARFHEYLSSNEIDAIQNLLPETLKLDKCDLERIISEKDSWVLKPSDLAEGEGVSVGQSMDVKGWKNALQNAMKNARFWILQQKVEIPETQFNLIDNGKITSAVKKYDFDPHVILFENHNEIGNILVRFSDSAILNVMKGGGLTYGFIKK